jgi:hypothetical protein
MTASEDFLPWTSLEPLLVQLETACKRQDAAEIRELLIAAPTAYQPKSDIVDHFWLSEAPQHNDSESYETLGASRSLENGKFHPATSKEAYVMASSASLEAGADLSQVRLMVDAADSGQR